MNVKREVFESGTKYASRTICEEDDRSPSPHYSWALLLQSRIRRCDKPGRGWHGVQADGLAAQSVNILFQVCFPPSRLRAPVSLGDCAISLRIVM